jgi:hypothetical protein
MHRIDGTLGATLTGSAACSILSFALRQLGRYLLVARRFSFLSDISARHDLSSRLVDSFPAAGALGIDLSVTGSRLAARLRAALPLALRIDSLLV